MLIDLQSALRTESSILDITLKEGKQTLSFRYKDINVDLTYIDEQRRGAFLFKNDQFEQLFRGRTESQRQAIRLWILAGKAMSVVHAPHTSLGSKFKTVHFAIMARLVNQTQGVTECRVDY